MQDELTYRQAGPLHQAIRRIGASGPGSWLFARVMHHVDRPVYDLTRGRHTAASLVSGLPVVMLTSNGARSGVPRTVPVLGLPTPDGLAVIASNYGQQHDPGWYHNLRANPEGFVSVEGVRRPFRAREDRMEAETHKNPGIAWTIPRALARALAPVITGTLSPFPI